MMRQQRPSCGETVLKQKQTKVVEEEWTPRSNGDGKPRVCGIAAQTLLDAIAAAATTTYVVVGDVLDPLRQVFGDAARDGADALLHAGERHEGGDLVVGHALDDGSADDATLRVTGQVVLVEVFREVAENVGDVRDLAPDRSEAHGVVKDVKRVEFLPRVRGGEPSDQRVEVAGAAVDAVHEHNRSVRCGVRTRCTRQTSGCEQRGHRDLCRRHGQGRKANENETNFTRTEKNKKSVQNRIRRPLTRE